MVAPKGKQIATFTVNGVDKIAELVDGKYTFIITSNTTVEAIFATKEYTVTFVDHDGTELKKETVEHGSGATAPAAPTREGYTFTGWDVDFDSVIGNLTVTAQYTIKTYTVTFDSRGGSAVELQTVNHEETATAPTAPTREGYSFTDWYTDEELTTAFDFATRIKTDTTIYAKWKINTYTLTYTAGANGSITGEARQTVNYKGSGTAVTAAANEGYHFVKWSDGSTESPRTDTNVLVDITVEALFAINEYTVTFVDWDELVIEKQTVKHGSNATTSEAPAREGYTFDGWDTDFTNVTSNLTVKATYKINTYTVTFKYDDGIVLATEEVEHGSAATAPSVSTREGYTFTGWDVSFYNVIGDLTVTAQYKAVDYTLTIKYQYTDGSEAAESYTATLNFSNAYEIDSPVITGYTADKNTIFGTMPADNVTVTVVYTVNEYTITFDSDGGSYVDSITLDYGAEVTPPADPTKVGYTFAGWTPKVPATMPAEDITLTAQWKVNHYTITFDSADGSDVPAITQDYGSTVTAPADPTKEGYTFAGWDPAVPVTMPAKDLALEAHWTPNTNTAYKVEHYQQDVTGDGYTLFETEDLTGTTDMSATATAKSYTGFTENTTHGSRVESGTIKPDGTLVLKLYYDRYTFTVTYDSRGGSTVSDTTGVRYGATIFAPTAPNKTGYTFAGWYKEAILTNAWDFENDTVTAAITLYAKWTPNDYTVTFNANGGNTTSPASKTITYANTYGELATTTRTGYSFNGWYTQESGGTKITSETTVSITANQTLYAQWTLETYPITYVLNGGTNDLSNPSSYTIETSDITLAAATKTGYTFDGWWDSASGGNQVTSIPKGSTGNKTLYAKYTDSILTELNNLIVASTSRTRPDYTALISEWDTYWNDFATALANAERLYGTYQGKDLLTLEEKSSLTTARQNLQRAVEILDGIEDFDVAFGDRVSPKGLEITVNDRSRVEGDGFQPHRLRAYYDKEKGDFYWLLSRYQQGQQFYAGTAGTGMNPGLKSVIASNTLIKVASGEYVIEIYKEDGTRKTEAELDNDAIFLALDWVDGKYSETYSYLAGRVRDFNLVGKTSDGTEYQRSYTFYFVDSGVYLFDPYFDYHVIGEVVQRDFRGFTIINATQNIGYSDSSIQAAIDVANPGDKIYVAAGTYSESVTINKSITLIGDYGDERFMGPGPNPPVLDGISLTGVPGFQIAAGVSDVTIKGFEIKNYDSGGIVGQGAGINNVKIEHNYIHDVGNDGVLGSTSGTQMLINWTVSQNLIKGFAGLGINLENVGDSLISENKISSLASEGSIAIEVMSRAVGNSITVSGVTISNNEITDYPNGAVNILAWAEGASSATVENINIGNNTFPGRAVNVEAWAEGASSATVKTVNINSNSIVFQDRAVCIAVQAADASSSATVEGVSIDGNTITGNITGIDVHKQGSGTTKLQNFTITGNNLTINNPKEAGCAIHLADVGGASNFSNNTITITGTIENGGNAFDGVDISGSATGSWTITGNELDGNNVGTASSGIHLRSSLPASAALNMEENTVTKWAQGILTDALVTGTTVELRRNRIFGNSSYGISNASSGATIDAILNYWGDKSGPYHSTNSSGLGNSVSDKVDFAPWHQDADFISLSDGTVVNIDKEKYYHSIQAAIDEAYPGDTIHVTAGTYYESVTINKSIILTGDCGDVGLPGPGSNAPILDGTGQGDHKHGFYINGDTASNVTIEGFVIRNFSGAEASGIFGHGVGVTDITLRYNYIHDVAAHGVRAFNAYKQESMTGWGVKHNVIEKFGGGGGCGIYFVGVSGSLISNNKIFNPTVNCSAILLKAEVTSNVHHIMSDITISGNEIIDYPDRAIYVLANANYSNTHATIENVNIAGNTVTGDAQAITFWAYGDGQNELKDMNITDNNITVNYPDSGGIEAVYLDNIRGSSNFSGNTLNVVGDGGGYCDGIIICGKDTGSWTLDNNYIDGHNKKSSYGVYYFWIPAAAPLNMNRNTFTGWDLGIRGHEGTEQATLRSNLIYGNNMGTNIYGPTIDATLNYWGDKSGPFHSTNQEGLGNAVTDGVLFAPWYADESCTIPSGEVAEGAFALAVDGAFGETFTVTFNGNGGTPTITEVEVEGEATVDTLPTVTRDGYTFVEWNTLHDGTGEVFTTETAVTADMTVYAIWEETVAGLPTIVSIADVDDLEVGYGTVEDDTIATLAATTIIKDSDSATHTVALSWTIADYDGNIAGDYTATGTFVLPEGVHQADPAMRLEVTATVTVKAEAVVEPLEEIFTVTFDGNEGTPATTEVEVEGEATVETLPTVDRDGYTFVVWNTAQDGAGEMFTTETTVTADMTVYAIWEEAEKDNEEQIETEEPVGEPGVEADENVVDEQVETGTDVGVINDTQEDE